MKMQLKGRRLKGVREIQYKSQAVLDSIKKRKFQRGSGPGVQTPNGTTLKGKIMICY
jgi:hypothetical protein